MLQDADEKQTHFQEMTVIKAPRNFLNLLQGVLSTIYRGVFFMETDMLI